MNEYNKETWQKMLAPREKVFEDNLRTLVMLLDHPQPGISSWHTARIELAGKVLDYLQSLNTPDQQCEHENVQRGRTYAWCKDCGAFFNNYDLSTKWKLPTKGRNGN